MSISFNKKIDHMFLIQYRALRFKSFIEDGIYFLEANQKDDALACLKAHKEEIDKRLASSRVPSEIKATETAILTNRHDEMRQYGFSPDS